MGVYTPPKGASKFKFVRKPSERARKAAEAERLAEEAMGPLHPPEPARPEYAPALVLDDSSAADFTELSALALKRALAIMRLTGDQEGDGKADLSLLRLQSGIIQSVMTAQVRVDRAKLRDQQGDQLDAMLAQARQARASLRKRAKAS
jgi:hypothetical protein